MCALTACEENNSITDTNTVGSNNTVMSTDSNIDSESIDGTDSQYRPPDKFIHVSDMEEFEKMREMLSCEDEKEFAEYLRTVRGGGAESKEDLEVFIKTVDALPIPDVISGKISWIAFFEDSGVIMVTRVAENGEFARAEFLLSVKDAKAEVESRISAGKIDKACAVKNVQNNAGDIKIFATVKKSDSSDKGTQYVWHSDVRGIYTRIYYYTPTETDISVAEFISDKQVAEFSKIAAMEQGR